MQRYANYELKKELGRGATARIYLAEHSETGAHVSLKIFHPQIFADALFAQRVQRELKVSADLKHPNIVAVQELIAGDPPALVMQYIDGSNLENFQGRLPYVLPELSALIGIEILKALEYAHGRGLVHRDLKPENVLVGQDGRVFVTDFGLAKTLDTTMITQTNVILGSLDYMSPEQARGDSVTLHSDLFSVSVMLYFLTTGTRPFTRANTVTTLAAIKEETAEAPHHRNPKLSAAFSRIIQKGMSKAPADRYQSAQEFREALCGYLRSIRLWDDHSAGLAHWISQPTSVTLEYLRTASDALVQQGEEALREKNWDKLLEAIAHLSLKAPQSATLSRLTEEYKRIQQGAKRKRWAIALPSSLVALAAIAGVGLWRPTSESAPPQPQAPLVSDAAVPAPVRAAPAAPTSPVASKPKPTGSVKFFVDEHTEVFWDGRKVNPKVLLTNQSLGIHKLVLKREGFDPIRTQVKVTPGKPVVVNAR